MKKKKIYFRVFLWKTVDGVSDDSENPKLDQISQTIWTAKLQASDCTAINFVNAVNDAN